MGSASGTVKPVKSLLPLFLTSLAITGCQPAPQSTQITFATSADGTIVWRFDHRRGEAWMATALDRTWWPVREELPTTTR